MYPSDIMEYISKHSDMSVEKAESLIGVTIEELVSRLIDGENVVLPGLGRLEVRIMPGRKTIIFRSDLQTLSGDEGLPPFYRAIIELLSNGKNVTLPSFGTFQPIFNQEAILSRVSFILSPALRSRINTPGSEKEEKSAHNPDPIEPSFIPAPTPAPAPDSSGAPLLSGTDEQAKAETVVPIRSYPVEQESAKPAPKNKRLKKKRETKSLGNIKKILFVLAFLLFVLLFILIKQQPHQPDIDLIHSSDVETSLHNLPDLSKEHYGHAAYWVYIYDFNQTQITNPLNPVRDQDLRYPDLQMDYNVDINDSLEIKRANMIAEELLNAYRRKRD